MTQESVITDDMRKMIGVEGVPTVLEVEKGAIRMIADAIEDPNPLWRDEEYAKKTKYGGIIAPPVFLNNARGGAGRGVELRTSLPRAMAGGEEFEYFQPVRPGDVITSVSRIVELNEKEGRTGKMLFNIVETVYKNQRNEVVAKCKTTWIHY